MNGIIPYCPKCGHSKHVRWDPATNSFVCVVHGIVLEDSIIDSGPEWRTFDAEDVNRRSRVGAPITERVHDRGITTFIRASIRDQRGRKLAIIQAKLRRSGNEKLIKLLSELNSTAARLGFKQHVIEDAAKLLRDISRSKILRKNHLYEYIAAALIIAAKINRIPTTITEVAGKLGISKERVWTAYRELIANLRVKLATHNPQLYVPKIVSKLGLSQPVETLANKIVYMLIRTGIAQGKPPQAVAAAAVYLASILLDEKKNQSQVAKVIGMTDATIRNRYRDVVDNFYVEVKL